jgi:hypothetical protein
MATMRNFSRFFILPMARKRKWNSFCEIGAQYGNNVDELLKFPLDNYTIIDPCFDENLGAKYAADPRVRVLQCNSLDALASGHLSPRTSFDCILIDGDHNWYTVFNELRLIQEHGLLRPGGYIFLHDIDWPYGRRDMYYQPDSIPAEFRRPCAHKGIVQGEIRLVETGGINAEFMNALEEGGARNGVLSAIEDFVAAHPGKYRFCQMRYQAGLGILQLRSGAVSPALSFYELWSKAAICNLFRKQIWAFRAVLLRRAGS